MQINFINQILLKNNSSFLTTFLSPISIPNESENLIDTF